MRFAFVLEYVVSFYECDCVLEGVEKLIRGKESIDQGTRAHI